MNRDNPLLAAELHRLYTEERLSCKQIGERVGLPHWTVRRILKKAGTQFRTLSESVSLRARERKKIPDAQLLVDLYVDKKLSASQIAKMVGCSQSTVLKSLHEAGVEVRNTSQAVRTLNLRGSKASQWKGGKMNSQGYIYIYIYCGHVGGKSIYRPEHVLVWERAHGPLPAGWVVHHLNGDRKDNRLENLVALPRSEHSSVKFLRSIYQRRMRQLERENKFLQEQVKTLMEQRLFQL